MDRLLLFKTKTLSATQFDLETCATLFSIMNPNFIKGVFYGAPESA